jgi:hypothetical protein
MNARFNFLPLSLSRDLIAAIVIVAEGGGGLCLHGPAAAKGHLSRPECNFFILTKENSLF